MKRNIVLLVMVSLALCCCTASFAVIEHDYSLASVYPYQPNQNIGPIWDLTDGDLTVSFSINGFASVRNPKMFADMGVRSATGGAWLRTGYANSKDNLKLQTSTSGIDNWISPIVDAPVYNVVMILTAGGTASMTVNGANFGTTTFGGDMTNMRLYYGLTDTGSGWESELTFSSITVDQATVPEPSSILAILSGIGSVGLVFRRKMA